MFWDSRSMAKPLKTVILDSSPGALVPMFDSDTSLLVLAARGDSTIRVMEVVEDAPFYYDMPPVFDKLPQRGVCMLPKRGCNVMGAEVVKLYRALNNSVVPIGFRVPRKHYTEFWEELFPDTPGPEPALSASQYLSGENKDPIKVSLRPVEENGYSSSTSSDTNTVQQQSSPSVSSTSNSSSSSQSSAPSSFIPSNGMSGRSSSVSSGSQTRNFFDTKPKEEVIEYYTPKEVKVVRSSKYRHILGKPAMKIHQYENMKVLSEAMQNRAIAGNNQWIGVSWQGVGGRIALFNVEKDKGRAPTSEFGMLETGSAVLDFTFNPFKSNQLITGGENGLIKIWEIPDTGLKSLKTNLKEAHAQLRGHQHKIVTTEFHPLAQHLLLSTSGDLTAKLWDISTQQDFLTLSGFGDLVLSSSWNFSGNTLATTSKDKTLRVWDVRSQSVAQSGPDIGGMLGTKVSWLGKSDQLVLVGFDKNSERTIQVVDVKKLGEPVASVRMDNSSSVLTPHYDPDTGVLMMWGKGDTSIKFYEINNDAPMIHQLTDHQTTVPQVGVALLHKTSCNVKEVEIAKVYKLSQTVIEPITFSVPRTKKEFFQDDIYSLTLSAEPSNDASTWISGTDKTPLEISLQPTGMPKLSEAPKQVVERRRIVVQDDSHMDLDKVKERMLGSLGALANIEDAPIPGDDKEGVDESEWDD
jgi:coronin-7